MRPRAVITALLFAALAPSPAAAAEPTAIDTIALWEAQGYTVNIDRIGSAPLEQCVVTGVRNPQQVTRWVRVEDNGGHHGGDDDDSELVEIVVSQSVSISLNCSG
jgi:hypothetical protein